MGNLIARPTVYKGIKMRSRLEAGFAAWLDTYTMFDWAYEPECFAGEGGQYLPDFLLRRVRHEGCPSWCSERHNSDAYVEVKPSTFFADSPSLQRPLCDPLQTRTLRAMEVIWESRPDALLLVAGPGHLKHLTPPGTTRTRWAPGLESFPHTARWISPVRGAGFVYGFTHAYAGDDIQPWPDGWWRR